MAVVVLPRSLTILFPAAERRVELSASSVEEIVDGLDTRWPGMRARLCEANGLRRHINVFVDGERADLGTSVSPQSVVHVIPAVSGGCGAIPQAEVAGAVPHGDTDPSAENTSNFPVRSTTVS